MVANLWRAALAASPHTTVVANADDPLVVWAAGAAAQVRYVGVGLSWHLDAGGCPSCEGHIVFSGDTSGGWRCVSGCGFARPDVVATMVAADDAAAFDARWADGRIYQIDLQLPGRFNRANALMVAVAAEALGVDPAEAFAAMATIGEVAGRFATKSVGGVSARLMLAKNPAGWTELLDLVAGDTAPLVVSINARIADGADPSWLWDVPFERLAGREVVATGDRCWDLSVRLRYAGVAHRVEPDPHSAVAEAAASDPKIVSGVGAVDVMGNYTAFGELLAARS